VLVLVVVLVLVLVWLMLLSLLLLLVLLVSLLLLLLLVLLVLRLWVLLLVLLLLLLLLLSSSSSSSSLLSLLLHQSQRACCGESPGVTALRAQVGVSAHHQGKGLGKVVSAACICRANELGHHELFLITKTHAARAVVRSSTRRPLLSLCIRCDRRSL